MRLRRLPAPRGVRALSRRPWPSAEGHPRVLPAVSLPESARSARSLPESPLVWPGYIQVDSLPEAAFTWDQQDGVVAFDNSSQHADTYLWTFGDNAESTEENPIHEYSESGEFVVTLIASNDCGADTVSGQLEIILINTEQPLFIEDFRLYPNPGSGAVYLEMGGQPRPEVQFDLFDMLGRRIYRQQENFQSGSLKTFFDWTHLPSATYILEVNSGNESGRWKIIIER